MWASCCCPKCWNKSLQASKKPASLSTPAPAICCMWPDVTSWMPCNCTVGRAQHSAGNSKQKVWKSSKPLRPDRAAIFANTRDYEGNCDYFLFDTPSQAHGGSGQKYDWHLLQDYRGATPFFLSGGLGPTDAEALRAFHHPQLAGIDLNSRFESSPARKDVPALQAFLNKYRQSNPPL